MMDAAPPPVRNRNGTFAKGHKQLGHRGMGKVNKLTADIKSGMMHSAIAHGRDGHGAGGLDGVRRCKLTSSPFHVAAISR